MNLFQRLAAFFARLTGAQPYQRQLRAVPHAGVLLTQDQALSVATVWACIRVLSESIAQCRWNIYEPQPGTLKRRALVDKDPRSWLLNTRPNPEVTAMGFREGLMLQALAWGNSYAEIQPDSMGRIVALWPLLTDRMQVQRNVETQDLEYHYSSANPGGGQYVIPAGRVFHLRGLSIDGLMGENVIARAVKSIAIAKAQEKFSADFFGRGAQLAGVLESPAIIGPDQHVQLRKEWDENHSGSANGWKPLILEGGLKFTPVSNNPKDATLVEDKQFTTEEICRWFGVPPHKVQHLLHATFSNIEHSSIEFVRDALTPWARRLEQEADYKLFNTNRAPWRETEIDLAPLTRGDALSRAQAAASWRQNGIMSANEIRALEGLDAVPDGDTLLVQSNLTTLDGIEAQIEKLRAPPPPPPAPPGAQPAEPDDDEEPVKRPTRQALALEIHRGTCKAALRGTFERYGRRLANRQASLEGKRDSVERITAFRAEQLEVITAELEPFADNFTAALGRNITRADCSLFAAAFEGGDRDLSAPFKQLEETRA